MSKLSTKDHEIKRTCEGCLHFRPSSESALAARQALDVARMAVKVLKERQHDLPEKLMRCAVAVERDLLPVIIHLRPDLKSPLNNGVGMRGSPLERCKQLLGFMETKEGGYIKGGIIVEIDLDKVKDGDNNYFKYSLDMDGTIANDDWCAHPKHTAIIRKPVGCKEREDIDERPIASSGD